jgi:hypothetical protein
MAVLAGLLFAAVSMAEQNVSARTTAGPLHPTTNANQVVGKQSFGPSSLTYVRTYGLNFYPYNSLSGYSSSGSLRWATTVDYGLEADLHVPTGAIIDYLELDACDTNAGVGMDLSILDCDPMSGGCGTVGSATLTTTGATGCQVVSLSGIGYEVHNDSHAIGLEAIDHAADGTLQLASVVVGYRLQVSPAPGSPTFADVTPDNIYYQFIEALAASGVTAGCDSVPDFCPDRNITRAEMAVFMAKALGLHFPN